MRRSALYTRGFTLIEILVALAIIVILVMIAHVSLGAVRDKAYDTQRKSDLAQLAIVLKLYKVDHGAYPLPGCGAVWNGAPPEYASPGPTGPGNPYVRTCDPPQEYITGLVSAYISKLPTDPQSENVLGEGFMYTSNGTSYKLVDTRTNGRMIKPTEDFARCPVSCSTCHTDPNTGEQAFAIYTPDMACQ
jgi:prepilin-type N-terminal cleavage/methylation domain-containing protein